MNRKALYLLLAATAILALLLAFDANDYGAKDPDVQPTRAFISGFKSNITDIKIMTISSAQKKPTVTLIKKNGNWVVAEKNNYPANKQKINKYLIALADATLLEAKTKRAELYPKLGLADLPNNQNESSNGVRLDILDSNNQTLAALLIGFYNSGADRGTYTRKVNETSSWLVSGDLSVEPDPKAWLNKDIIHVSSDGIQKITVRRPNEEAFVILKNNPTDKHFAIANLAEDAKLASEHAHDSISNGLRYLRCNDVFAVEEVNLTAGKQTQIEYQLFDDLLILANITEIDDNYYLALTAKRGDKLPTVAGTKNEAAKLDSTEIESGIEHLTQLQQKFSGRLFSIPSYKAATMNKVLADFLLEEPEEETVAEVDRELR